MRKQTTFVAIGALRVNHNSRNTAFKVELRIFIKILLLLMTKNLNPNPAINFSVLKLLSIVFIQWQCRKILPQN